MIDQSTGMRPLLELIWCRIAGVSLSGVSRMTTQWQGGRRLAFIVMEYDPRTPNRCFAIFPRSLSLCWKRDWYSDSFPSPKVFLSASTMSCRSKVYNPGLGGSVSADYENNEPDNRLL